MCLLLGGMMIVDFEVAVCLPRGMQCFDILMLMFMLMFNCPLKHISLFILMLIPTLVL